MTANFVQLDANLVDAAASLGAPPFTAFRRITLPLVVPGLVLSAAISFLVSFNDVIVSSPNVPKPAAVRYAWAFTPVCNLTNAEGLPASPFRTDDWQLETFGK